MNMLKKILFGLGVILLLINIIGLFKTMRNPELYTLEKTIKNRLNDVTIPYPEIKGQLERKKDESDRDFAVRVNKVVNDGFAHYWKREGTEKYHMRVPVWENYILYAASYINPEKYERYEFADYKKNLERGVGLCSSHSTVVKGILLDNGIKAELMDVGGRHVVVRAQLSDTAAYILDPDFGYYIPHDTAAITANPELARAAYADMANLYYKEAKDPYTVDLMTEIFGNRKYIYTKDAGFENFSYWAKWLLPLLLMVPFGISLFKQK